MSTSFSAVRRVLVIGYGSVGSSVLRALSAPQYADRVVVSALVRPSSLTSTSASKVAVLSELTQLGVHLIAGDIESDDQVQLTKTLSGFDTVISTIEYSNLRIQFPLVQAAAAAGVRHFFPSEFAFYLAPIGRGSAVSAFDDKLELRDVIRQSGMNYTFVEVGAFTEYITSPAFGVNIADGTVSAPGSLQTTVTAISVVDIGILTAAAVFSSTAINQIIQFAGDTVTFNDIADIIEDITGKTVIRSVRTVADIKSAVVAHPDDWIARFNVIMAQNIGLQLDISTSWNAINMPHYKPTTVTDYIRAQINKLSA